MQKEKYFLGLCKELTLNELDQLLQCCSYVEYYSDNHWITIKPVSVEVISCALILYDTSDEYSVSAKEDGLVTVRLVTARTYEAYGSNTALKIFL